MKASPRWPNDRAPRVEGRRSRHRSTPRAEVLSPLPATLRSGLPLAKNLQTVARRALTPCAATDAFRFADGALARDLADLRHHVGAKSAYLVTHHKQEYAAWVERVLGDPALARRIERLARRRVDGEAYRVELTLVLDERIGKLRDRVI